MTIFLKQLVSNDTFQKLKIYERLLREWNRMTALVQEDTLDSFEFRHVIDSLQIIPVIQSLFSVEDSRLHDSVDCNLKIVKPFAQTIQDPFTSNFLLDDKSNDDTPLSIIDVGTGAGLPGMVLAICGFQNVTLCDSNHKKCLFLSEVARHTGAKVLIVNDRVENLRDKYDLIVSRACTDLNSLCRMMKYLASSELTCGIFHKGRSWNAELVSALMCWKLNATAYRSVTSDDSVVLLIQYLETYLN